MKLAIFQKALGQKMSARKPGWLAELAQWRNESENSTDIFLSMQLLLEIHSAGGSAESWKKQTLWRERPPR